jgi:hypothetical protein
MKGGKVYEITFGRGGAGSLLPFVPPAPCLIFGEQTRNRRDIKRKTPGRMLRIFLTKEHHYDT